MPDAQARLSGRRIVVSGAGIGIGRACDVSNEEDGAAARYSVTWIEIICTGVFGRSWVFVGVDWIC